MDMQEAISGFLNRVRENPRVGPSHVSLFLAIAYLCRNSAESGTRLFSHEIMSQAKISAAGTYHKCLRDLVDMGYLRYEPSYHAAKGSKICLQKLLSETEDSLT